MAVRFLFPTTGAAPVVVAPDPSWDVISYRTGGRGGSYVPTYDSLQCNTARATSAFVQRVSPKSIAGTAQRTLLRQYISEPMNAQTITASTLKGILRAAAAQLHSGTLYPLAVYYSCRIVSRAGSVVRGTIFALQADGTPTTAFVTAFTDRKAPALWAGAGAATSAVTCSQGDRFVHEFGVGRAGTPGAGPFADTTPKFDFGVTGTDLPEDETGTTQLSPFIEIAFNVTWEAAGGGVIDPGTAPAAVSPAVTPQPRAPETIPWRWMVCDLAGTPISDITAVATGKDVTPVRNAPAVAVGSAPADHPSIKGIHTDGDPYMNARNRVLKGFRLEAGVYVPRFTGRIQVLNHALGVSGRVGYAAADALEEMKYQACRDTSGNLGIGFGDTAVADIVRLLIDNANGYAVLNAAPIPGLQTIGGTFPLLGVQSPSYDGAKDVYSAITDLGSSDTTGFDIWAAPLDHRDSYLSRTMLYAKPAGMGAARPDVVFGWHAPPFNLPSLQIVDDGTKQANVVIVSSGGNYATTTDGTSLLKYGPVHTWVSGSGDTDQATYLAGLAAKALNPNPPRSVTQATVAPGLAHEPWLAWFVGDAVTVNVGPDWYGGAKLTATIEAFTVNTDNFETLKNLAVRV